MTAAELVSAVASEIKKALTGLKLPTEYHQSPAPENFVSVNVFEQYVPADLFEQSSYFPCVVVEWLETRDDLKAGSVMTIGLTCGVFAKEADGYMDALHLAEVIRQRLLTHRLLAKKFRLVDEATWTTPTQQPTPFFIVLAELKYSAQIPLENFFVK